MLLLLPPSRVVNTFSDQQFSSDKVSERKRVFKIESVRRRHRNNGNSSRNNDESLAFVEKFASEAIST